MKRFSKAAVGSGNEHRIKRYVFINDQPQEVTYGISGGQATQKAKSVQSKQERMYAVDKRSKTFIKAPTDAATHHTSKEKLIEDRAWIKHAYLHSTSPPIQLDEATRDTQHSHLQDSVVSKGKMVTLRYVHSAHGKTNTKSSTKMSGFSKKDTADITSSSEKEEKATVSSRQTERETPTNLGMPSVGVKSQVATSKRAYPKEVKVKKNQTAKCRDLIEQTVSGRNEAVRKNVSSDRRLESKSVAKKTVDTTRVKVRPVDDQSTSKKPLIQQAEIQTNTIKPATIKASNRSTREMVILKHPPLSSCTNYGHGWRKGHLHSDDTTRSTKQYNLHKAETFHGVKALDNELVVAHRHDQQRGKVVQQFSKWRPRQEAPPRDGTESMTEKVATVGSKKAEMNQHQSKYLSSSGPTSTVNSTEEESQKLRRIWRGNRKPQHIQSYRKEVQLKEKAFSNIAKLVPSDSEQLKLNDDGVPVLPERGYLEDIDFVVSEFDMILCSDPHLPARAYLEDIDFLSKEFNLFFKRKPGSQECKKSPANNNDANEVSDMNEKASITEARERPHCQSRHNDQVVKDQNDTAGSIFNAPASTHSHYQPRLFGKDTKTEHVYATSVPPKGQPTSVVCSSSTNSSEAHYQPLMFERLDTSSLYDSIALKQTQPTTSLFPGPVKVKKIVEQANASSNLIPSSGSSGKANCPKFRPLRTSDCNSTPVSFKRKCKEHPIYVDVNIDPHQPPTIATSDASVNNAMYSTEENPYQPLIFSSHKSQEESNYMLFNPPKSSAAVAKGHDGSCVHWSTKSLPKPLGGDILRGDAVHQTVMGTMMVGDDSLSIMGHESLNKQNQSKDHHKHNTPSGLPPFRVPI